ncbi:MAG: YqaE/Pmp3 family membrane protein [Bacteroidia bacterium]
MKKSYYFLFLLSFFAFLPLAQAGAPAAITAPGFNVEANADMSRAEKRELRKELRQATREARQGRPTAETIAIICAILIPPLGVYLHQGKEITTDFWVTLALWILTAWIGGAIYALIVVLDVFSLA